MCGGGGGLSPKFFLFHWNPNIFVSKEPMQNFKILQYTLLGEKEHKEKKGRKKKERKKNSVNKTSAQRRSDQLQTN